ncbi:uncharacterized protein LOC6534252 [Drosophila yakuba]|uniref:F-box domain-containing protein n=1 Tax=Drosophila yakuba TaxID=7245 RepID=B4PJF8_DROYA|nr:uncharacterized protein LOC6534252 [Drosophila yakuba]EDW94646.2 uncharacterized protein Dyak_GE22095 [Drosophila yakuba]
MENQRTISDLPFELLDLIFEKLESIVDKLQLAQVNEKLGEAFAFHSRSAYKKLQSFFGQTPEMWVVIVSLCGSTVEEFSSRKNWDLPWSDIVAKSIEQHCPNLKSVRIDVCNENCDSVQSFLLKMSKLLVSVELTILTDNPEKIFDAIAEMTNMTRLICRGNINKDVYQIQKLLALQELVLEHNKFYYPDSHLNVLEICAQLTSLRSLTVQNITIRPSEQPHSMIWPELEFLKICNCEIYTELPECPKLKTLGMIKSNCHIEGLLLRFILQNGVNIKQLNESCHPPPFDGDNFLQVLRSCPKLRVFLTPMTDISIHQAFVSSIVEVLKDKGFKQEDPFNLIIYARDKLKWIRRLIPRTSNPELIALDYLYDFFP